MISWMALDVYSSVMPLIYVSALKISPITNKPRRMSMEVETRSR